MSKIYALCGLSGSGKTTIAKKIIEILDIPLVVAYTTRPIRPGEEQGVDYHFINDRQWNLLSSRGALVAGQTFKVDGGHLWRYGFLQDDLEESCIMVLTPSGIEDLKKLGYNIISIYIDIDENIRLKRIIERKDNQSEAEIIRRTNEDKLVFDSFIADYKIDNSGELYDVLFDIIELVI